MSGIRGVITAMATPFDGDGRVDEGAARRLAASWSRTARHGLVIAGTTGESPTLSDEEKLALLAAVRDEVGAETSVICGTGSNDTRHTVELTAAAAEAGADAALVVTPYYNKPNRAGILAHYERGGPRSGCRSSSTTSPRGSWSTSTPPGSPSWRQIENVVAVKQANDDELGPIEGLDVLAGNDGVFLRHARVRRRRRHPRRLAPGRTADAGDLGRGGRRATSIAPREIDAELQPVYEAISVTNPITVKAGLAMLGLIEADLRLPLVPAEEDDREAVRAALEGAGVLATAG